MATDITTSTGSRVKNLIGLRVGRLEVVSFARRNQKTFWNCRCDCGNPYVVDGGNLQTAKRVGMTLSCGCWRRERLKTHGLSKHPLFAVWYNMMGRCYDPKHTHYARYGGRGIKVCERWQDRHVFLEDVRHAWKPKHQLDRINNDGNYEPTNCRFVTRLAQMNNVSSNHRITHNGVSLTAAEWARKIGFKQSTIRARILYGWSDEKIVTTPIIRGRPKRQPFGLQS